VKTPASAAFGDDRGAQPWSAPRDIARPVRDIAQPEAGHGFGQGLPSPAVLATKRPIVLLMAS
jgi:hypothetical protein